MEKSGEPIYDVLSPVGAEALSEIAPTAPAGALSTAVIGQVWDYMFRGDEIFRVIQEALEQRAPGVRFIDYSVFGNIHGPDQDALTVGLPDKLNDHACTAVIVGIGA